MTVLWVHAASQRARLSARCTDSLTSPARVRHGTKCISQAGNYLSQNLVTERNHIHKYLNGIPPSSCKQVHLANRQLCFLLLKHPTSSCSFSPCQADDACSWVPHGPGFPPRCRQSTLSWCAVMAGITGWHCQTIFASFAGEAIRSLSPHNHRFLTAGSLAVQLFKDAVASSSSSAALRRPLSHCSTCRNSTSSSEDVKPCTYQKFL